jgi:hypothetical protein
MEVRVVFVFVEASLAVAIVVAGLRVKSVAFYYTAWEAGMQSRQCIGVGEDLSGTGPANMIAAGLECAKERVVVR